LQEFLDNPFVCAPMDDLDHGVEFVAQDSLLLRLVACIPMLQDAFGEVLDVAASEVHSLLVLSA
jgi:hypothetical protein